MADGIAVTPGSGTTVGTDEVTGLTPTLSGTSQVQYTKIVDGTVDSVNKLVVASGALGAQAPVDSVLIGGVACAISYAFTTVAASTTDAAFITAVTSKRIYVLCLTVVVQSGGTTAVTFNSKPAGAGTAISPPFFFNANGGIDGYKPLGYFRSNVGEGVSITTGSGTTVSILATYAAG